MMQRDFINIAAHELRTPIQPILGLSEVVSPRVGEEEREYMGVIIRNAKKLHRLTEEILDVTKIESQSLRLKKEEFNLNDVIENSINDLTMNNYANGKNDIKIFYEPKDIFVKADKERISQVISNLISNAIKFTSKGSISILPSVRIKDGEQKEAIVSIKDTGQGIESDMLPKLFTKFTSKSFSGTGLGLYICKSIVESHGLTLNLACMTF